MDQNNQRIRFQKTALILAWLTVGYNVIEGLVSVGFGATDDALALFGFGIDSFVEVVSGAGILHMLYRMRKNEDATLTDGFEKNALRITGTGFYILAVGLIVGAVIIAVKGIKPETTIPGLIIALVSIATMCWLMMAKKKVGKALGSAAILADAACTQTCLNLSFVLLGASALWYLFKVPYIDSAGSVLIAWFCLKEGREAFEKAAKGSHLCNDGCGDTHCDNNNIK